MKDKVAPEIKTSVLVRKWKGADTSVPPYEEVEMRDAEFEQAVRAGVRAEHNRELTPDEEAYFRFKPRGV